MFTRILPLVLLLAALPAQAANPEDTRVPLFFVANSGQAPAEVRFMAKGSGLTAYFLPDEAIFRTFASSVRMRIEGASPDARVEGAGRLPGRVSFLTGPEENWHSGLPTYGAVAYRGLYPGIDMVYGGSGRNLKSEFMVAPGAEPSQIRLRYIGAGEIRIDANGALVIPLNGEVLRERAPEVYQHRDGRQIAVEGRFQVGADGAIGFVLGDYDRSLPLVIDPVISYSTFLGGAGANTANALAVDTSGAVYVAGFTESISFPTLTPVQAANAGSNDVFVAKLNAAGNALVYATYLGGRGDDRAFGIAVDSTGAAYVTGWTQSTNFPVRNALQASLVGSQNAFLVKLTAAGNGLVYSTYLGGSGKDSGNGIAVDSGGNAYVVGDTTSTNFPVSGFQTIYQGGQDAFVAKLNASGSSLVYSTYLGGGNLDHGAAIAVDASGIAYITGSTSSTNFPVGNAFQAANGGGQNAFVTRLNAAGSALLFSTFLGGSGGRTGYPEGGQGIAVDSSGNSYVAGVTSSANFPLVNPEQSALNGSSDAFIAKMSAAGALVYSTYLGGSGIDSANAIAVDSSGNTYFAGYTYSIDLPVVSPVQASIGSIGSTDAFVGKLNPAGSALSFLTYLGGNDSDTATGVAVDAAGSIYVAGFTLSSNFPVVSAYQPLNVGDYDAFITKYIFSVGPVNVGVTPSSGSGSAQTFSFAYSDSNGTSDLTSVAALFNTSTSLAAACAVIYNPAQNTLVLLTDAGSQPASSIAPGSGSQQNSQCVLSGSGSSVVASGNLLTLNLAITFLGAFNGAKNVYMQSSNPFQITAWQLEGAWSTPASISLAVTPSSGNATQQTFAFTVTDPLGVVADLTSAGMLINTSTSIVAACSVIYNRALNTLALTTDSGAPPAGSITPGSGSQQNSQCVLNGAGSSVTVAGNVLTVNLALSFQPAFGGSKNVYMDAVSKNGALNWTQVGAWISPPVVAMQVLPASGSGNQQTFSVQVSDSTGAADLTTIGLLLNTTATTTSACAIFYNQAQNALMLLTNTGAQPAASITPGAGAQQNSQCVLNGAASSVSVSGNTLNLLLAVTFQPAFSGVKNTYAEAANPYETVNWQLEGTWTSPPAITLAVTPASGSGAQQTFAFSVTDSLAATDLTTVGVLFNSTVSVVGACSVTYNRALNTLALLTDAGTPPATTITPGSGSQTNSQCVLSGVGSSVSSSANVLTLNLSLTFQPAFTGTKNVYMDAADPYETVAWQLEGVWVAAAVPSIVVTPSTGSANQQTFSLQVTDPLGAADLATVGLLFNSTVSTVSACAVLYNRAQNTLMLVLDSGALPPTSITPGSGSQQNNQCVLSGAGSSVSSSGNVLTVNIAIAFQPAFSGTKNSYGEAIGATQSVNWQMEGTWTSPPVVTLALTPLSGSGTQQSFTLKVTDSLAGSDLTTVGLLINSSTATSAACSVTYNSAQNTLALLTDAGTAPATAITPGSGTQQNSQCVLNGSGSSVSVSGTTLTVNIALAFQPAFTGSKNVYMEAANPYETLNWQLEGVWVVPSALLISVSPSSGSAVQQTFTLQVTDPAGASDLTTVGLLFNSSVSTTAACAVLYNRAQNTLMLLTDAGAAPAGSISPGSSGTQQNSQCVLNGIGSSASVGGNVLSVAVSIGFSQTFTGTKNLYAEAIGVAQSLNWQQEGVWALPQVLAMAVTPSSGTGTQQTFSLQFFDSLGAADLTTVGVLFNTSASVAAACAVTYNRAQNALSLLTDAGAAPGSSLTPGSGSQQNSQCTLNGAASTASASGDTLTVTVSIAFLPAFSGLRNLYMETAGSFQTNSWTLEGSWASPPLVTMSMSPSSGGGPQQVFAFQVSDSIAATDLTTVGVLFNASVSTVGACAVMYNRAQNALTLLTDAGAPPPNSLTPGAGSQQNSQCTLNGAGSSVSTSGTTLTLNLSLSFAATWVGTKTAYMEAVNPYQSGTWTSEGHWVTSASLTLSESPASGNGTQGAFTVQATDSWGATDVSSIGILFNSSASVVGACAVIFNWAQNTLQLLTDAGAVPAGSIVPGSGTQQNSQCTLNGAGSSASVNVFVMTLTVSVTFKPVFGGTQNVYVEASDPFHAATWTAAGTWTVPQGLALAVTPSSGSATQQTFSLQITDTLGAADLTAVGILFNTSSSTANACAVTYNPAQNALALLTNTGAAPSGSLTPGSGTQQNSQCILNGAGSSVTASGNVLTVNLAITFQPVFLGAQNLYLEAATSFQAAVWTLEGSWRLAPVVALSMSPTSGGGPQQVFTLQFSDSSGATDLATVGFLFNTSVSTVSACAVMYNRVQNALTLLTDAGAAPSGSLTPGSGSQQNSQCTLNGAGSSVTTSGTTLTLNLSLSFAAAWVGAKTAYMEAVNPYQSGTWTSEGRWVTSASLTISESPTSGTGAQAVFAIQASDSWGATDVATIAILFNATASTTGACAVTYNSATNALALLTNTGAAPASSITPGAGTQQNSQCTLNGGASSVTVVGTVMTLNVSIAFQTAFAGTQNVYAEASDPFHAASWVLQGTWIVPGSSLSQPGLPAIALAVSPALGSGPGQTFTFAFSDAGGAAKLSTIGVLIGATANTAGVCAVVYNPALNSLSLLTDTGALPPVVIAPGGGSQQNSQCSLNGAASTVSFSGSILQLNLALSFQPAFYGAQNIYMEAGDSSTTVAWQAVGSWTAAPNGASPVGVAAAPAAANQQVFNFRYTDTAGTADLSTVYAWFMAPGDFFGFANSCIAYYSSSQNLLYLSADGAFWQAPAQPGAPAVLSNSQCSINVAASGVTASGNDLILSLAMTFSSSYSGTKNLFLRANSAAGTSGGWSNYGPWSVRSSPDSAAAPTAPVAMSVLPQSGAGYQQTFDLQYSDPAGFTDLSTVWASFAPGSTRAFSLLGCTAYYSQTQNLLYLVSDENDYIQSASPGAPAVLLNSQCSIDVAATRVTASGTNLTLVLPMTFSSSYSGSKSTYMNALSVDGAAAGWMVEGSWSVPQPRTPPGAQR